MSTDLLFVTTESGQLDMTLQGKTSEDDAQVYQEFMIALLTSSNDYFRTNQGTGLTESLIGSNLIRQYIQQVGTIATAQAKSHMNSNARALIDQSSVQLADSGALIVTLTFTDGKSISQEI